MSATISDKVMMKEVLKATGFDCPQGMENKTFEEATSGGGGGGSGITVEPITITQNGTTTAPSGKAYSPITVNVSKEVVLSVPVLPDGFTIEKNASQGGSVVISSPTAFSFFSVEPTGTYKDGELDVTQGSLGNVDRGSYICIFRDSNYNTLIGMGRWRDYEALTN